MHESAKSAAGKKNMHHLLENKWYSNKNVEKIDREM